MASARTLRAGKAVIELSMLTGDVEKSLKRIQSKMQGFGKSLQSLGAKGLAVSAALSAPFVASIKNAGDAQEILSRFKAVFADQTDAAAAFADSLANSVGRSSTAIKDGMASFQAFFVGLGLAGDESRKLSERLSALAIDFASFNNMSDAEAQQRFISALSGSSEVLDMYGINIKVAALDQELLNMGFKGGALAASEEQKALARLNIIMASMTSQGAVGDAVRTSGSFANQLKALQGRTYELSVSIGNQLLPISTKFLEWMNDAIQKITNLNRLFPGFAEKVFQVAIALGVASAAALGLGLALTMLSAHPLIFGVSVLVGLVGALVLALGDVEKTADRAVRAMARLAGVDMKAFDKIWEFQRKMGQFNTFAPEDPGGAGMPTVGAPVASGGGIVGAARSAINQAVVQAKATALRIQFETAGPINSMIEQAKLAFERMREIGDEGQRLEDEIARARIAGMTDNAAREKALIKQEFAERLRLLKAEGLLTPAIQAQLEQLQNIQLKNAGMDFGGGRMVENQAMFDTRFAELQFGGANKGIEDRLDRIARNTDPRNQQGGGGGILIV